MILNKLFIIFVNSFLNNIFYARIKINHKSKIYISPYGPINDKSEKSYKIILRKYSIKPNPNK